MSAAGMAARPVDLAHLACYTGGDTALNAEVLELFAGQAAKLLDQLHAALSARDQKSWREVTHALKGGARGIGAFALADAAAAAEECRLAEDEQRSTEALKAMAANARSVELFIKAYLGH